ncbi:MAG: UV excision repair protein RAD23 B, partial [Paramarteilia canceri]
MKVSCRTLDSLQFWVEIEDSKPVNQLKELIHNQFGPDYLPINQMLILYSKLIEKNETLLSELDLKEDDSILVLGYKHRNPIPEPKATKSKANSDKNKKSKSNPENSTKFVPCESSMSKLAELGFGKENILKALELADNNLEKATELILD